MKKEELKKEFKSGTVTINKDNIHLYYEFMSDEDIEKYKEILNTIFIDRYAYLYDKIKIKIDMLEIKTLFGSYHVGLKLFRVKDTLKPIDEYIKEIKESSEYIDKESYYQFYKDGKWWDKPHKLTVTEAKEEFEALGLQYKKISTK